MKIKYIILIPTIICFNSCHKNKKCKNDVFPLIQNYCPDGPNSCSGELISLTGYLDHNNICNNKIFLYSNSSHSSPKDNCYNTDFIEVYYPVTDLSGIFNYEGNEYYSTDLNVKVVINNAKIYIWHRDHPGVDDGNYLKVDSIQQITFYKIESNGHLTELKP